MSYAIANVIYGIPFDPRDEELIDDDKLSADLDDGFEQRAAGFLKYYSGSGDTPYAFGVEIFEFDECSTLYVKDMVLTPSKEQIKQFKQYFDMLSPELKAYLDKIKPATFILWSSSWALWGLVFHFFVIFKKWKFFLEFLLFGFFGYVHHHPHQISTKNKGKDIIGIA